MGKGARFMLLIFIVGIAMFIAGLPDAMLVINDTKLSFNSAEKADFEQEQLVEGNINFALGPFTTYEESTKYMGFINGKKKMTDFYIVGTQTKYDKNHPEKFNEQTFVILSTSDKELRSKLTSLSNKWISFANSMKGDAPTDSIAFEGKLASQPTANEYEQYKADTLKSMEISETDIPLLRIVEGKLGFTQLALCFGGGALALLSLVIFIISLVSASKARKRSQLY